MMTYPNNWPRCPVCGDFALDGHITCGRLGCNEGKQRQIRAEQEHWRRILAQPLELRNQRHRDDGDQSSM